MRKMKELLDGINNGSIKIDISQYQSYVEDLYWQLNEVRDFADIYGFLDRNIGFLGKSISLNPNDYSKFISSISWFFSLANKLGIKVSNAFNKKYLIGHSDYKFDVLSFDEAVRCVAEIFPSNDVIWKTAGYHPHMLRIHEETAEIHEAYSRFLMAQIPLSAVEDKIADVFAWIVGAWAILNPNQSLDKAFTDYYQNDCPVCNSAPCLCGLHDSRPPMLVDLAKLKDIREKTGQITKLFPNYQKDFSSLLVSFDSLIQTQNGPMILLTLSQTKFLLEKIKRSILPSGDGGNGLSIIRSTLDEIGMILRLEESANVKSKHFDVFLSYSTSNKDQVRVIFDFLTNKKVNVFMSEKKIQPSSNWEDVIKDALKNSRLLCLIASPESLASEWVKTEADSAWILETPILPILYHCAAKDLPDKLRRIQCIDYHEYPKIIDVLRDLS